MNILGKRIPLWAIATVVVAIAVGISAIFARRTAAASEFFTEPVQRGPIRNVVNATGTVQAVLTVQVGSQVSGQIQALYADYNSVVKRGQLLAKIDPRNFEAQVAQAKANEAAADARVTTVEADLNNQVASLQSAKANLEAAKVARDNAAQIFERYKELRASGVVSQNDYDNSKATADGNAAKYTQAEAQVKQGDAQINSFKAQVTQAKAQVEQAKAALNQAQINLEYTSIYSPVDGVVVSRNVDVGQTVAASLQTPTLYLIANDLTKMQVNASVDEADIGNISNAVDVQFTVDAFRNDVFRGKISEIRLNPQTVQNVVTYSVIVSVDNSQLKLKPGMTANIRMTVAQRDNVIKVPNAALRYIPPGMTREQVAQMARQQAPGSDGAESNQPGSGTENGSANAGGHQQAEDGGNAREGGRRAEGAPGGGPVAMRQGFQPSGSGRGGHARGEGRGGAEAITVGPEPAQAVLAPGQMWNPAEKIQFPTTNRRNTRPAVLWCLGADKKPEPRQVLLGITDGVSTEVVSGELKEGDKIIVADSTQAVGGAQAGGPRPAGGMPFGFGRR
jgi:HlyD family secretion protein